MPNTLLGFDGCVAMQQIIFLKCLVVLSLVCFKIFGLNLDVFLFNTISDKDISNVNNYDELEISFYCCSEGFVLK